MRDARFHEHKFTDVQEWVIVVSNYNTLIAGVDAAYGPFKSRTRAWQKARRMSENHPTLNIDVVPLTPPKARQCWVDHGNHIGVDTAHDQDAPWPYKEDK